MISVSKKDLVIIGGGNGLCMAREAKMSGVDYIVIEASNNVGGVWNTAFNTSRLQTHWKNYKFSNYSSKNSNNSLEFPFSREILEYLNDFNKDNSFNIIFNTRVIKCFFNNEKQIWHVETITGSVFECKYLRL